MNFIFLVFSLFQFVSNGIWWKMVRIRMLTKCLCIYMKDVPLICLLLLLLVTTIPNSINERRRRRSRRKVLHLEQHLLCLARSGNDSMMHTKFEQQYSNSEPSQQKSERIVKNRKTRNEWIILWLFPVTFRFYSVFRLQNGNGNAVCIPWIFFFENDIEKIYSMKPVIERNHNDGYDGTDDDRRRKKEKKTFVAE